MNDAFRQEQVLNMRFLFWNTNDNKAINPILIELIIGNQIDCIILAEYSANAFELLNALNYHGYKMKSLCTAGCKRITIFSKTLFEPGEQNANFSLQIMPGSFILCCVHLPSNIFEDAVDKRPFLIREIIEAILNAESNNNMENTIITGDFNINPFSMECIQADLFNSMPHYEIASNKVKNIYGKDYFHFYNPMWRFLGDCCQPFGTYYHDKNGVYNIYWHILDQVMIRPSLRERFKDNSLKIITESISWSLLDENGHPDSTKVSDHLPIMFELEEDSL